MSWQYFKHVKTRDFYRVLEVIDIHQTLKLLEREGYLCYSLTAYSNPRQDSFRLHLTNSTWLTVGPWSEFLSQKILPKGGYEALKELSRQELNSNYVYAHSIGNWCPWKILELQEE